MNNSAPTTLFSGATSEWREIQRRMRDMQEKRASLLTHRDSREFEESTELPVFADEGLDAIEDDKRIFRAVWLMCGGMVAVVILMALLWPK